MGRGRAQIGLASERSRRMAAAAAARHAQEGGLPSKDLPAMSWRQEQLSDVPPAMSSSCGDLACAGTATEAVYLAGCLPWTSNRRLTATSYLASGDCTANHKPHTTHCSLRETGDAETTHTELRIKTTKLAAQSAVRFGIALGQVPFLNADAPETGSPNQVAYCLWWVVACAGAGLAGP